MLVTRRPRGPPQTQRPHPARHRPLPRLLVAQGRPTHRNPAPATEKTSDLPGLCPSGRHRTRRRVAPRADHHTPRPAMHGNHQPDHRTTPTRRSTIPRSTTRGRRRPAHPHTHPTMITREPAETEVFLRTQIYVGPCVASDWCALVTVPSRVGSCVDAAACRRS